MATRATKITFAEMRDSGVLRLRRDYRCSHSIAISGDRLAGRAALHLCGRAACRGATTTILGANETECEEALRDSLQM